MGKSNSDIRREVSKLEYCVEGFSNPVSRESSNLIILTQFIDWVEESKRVKEQTTAAQIHAQIHTIAKSILPGTLTIQCASQYSTLAQTVPAHSGAMCIKEATSHTQTVSDLLPRPQDNPTLANCGQSKEGERGATKLERTDEMWRRLGQKCCSCGTVRKEAIAGISGIQS